MQPRTRHVTLLALLGGTCRLIAQTTPADSDAEKDEPVDLSPFVVSASASSTGRYASFEATSAGRTRVDIMDSAQGFSVITAEMLQDVAGSRIVDAARYVAGVTDSSLPTSWDRTNMRGFLGDGRTVDGFTFGAYPHYGVLNQDPAIVDRIEVVKGPSSVLSPQPTSPGGTINNLTKKPQFRDFGLINLQWGRFGANSALIDMNHAVNQKLAARLVASRRDFDHYWDGAYVRATTIMPELTYRFSSSTEITAQYVFADWKASNYLGLPIDPTSGTSARAHLLAGVPRDLNVFADDVVRTDEQHDFKVFFTSELWHGIQMRLAASYHTVSLYVAQLNTGPSTGGDGGERDPLTGLWNYGLGYQSTSPYAASPLTTLPTRIFRRGGVTLESDPSQFQVQNDYAYVCESDVLKSTTVVGFTFKDTPEYNSQSYNISAANLDIDNYVDAPWTRGTLNYHLHRSGRFRQAYVSENLALWRNRLILNGANSWKDFRSRAQNMVSNGITDISSSTSVPSYGVVIKPHQDAASLYYTHTKQSSETGASTGLEPPLSTARQDEFGVRFRVWDNKLFITAAYFDIIQDNYPTANPGNLTVPPPQPLLPLLYSDRQAKGWEYELRAHPSKNLSVVASYTQFRNRDPNNVEFRGIAEKAGGLLASYAFDKESIPAFAGFRIAVGIDYLGKRPGDTPLVPYTIASTPTKLIPNQASFYLGTRTLVNLTLAYDRDTWGVQVNVDNLLDKKYLMAANIRNGVFPGPPTNLRASLRLKF